jgi:hypothetical protein
MLQTQLYQLLATLSKEEWSRFRDFANSPYHNRSQKILALLEQLLPHFPIAANESEAQQEKREHQLSREVLSPALFPDKSPESSNLDNLFHAFKKLVFSFLSAEQLGQDEGGQRLALLTDLAQRPGASPFFEKNWKKAHREAEAKAGSSLELFHHQLQLQNLWLTYTVLTGARDKDFPLAYALDQLRRYTLTAQLKYALGALNRRRLVGQSVEIPFLEDCLKQVEASPDLQEVPVIALYYRLVCCFLDPEDPSLYATLEEATHQYLDQLDAPEQGEVFAAHINYLIGRWRAGAEQLDKIFSIYQAYDASGALATKGVMQAGNYLNVIDVGLSLIRAAREAEQQQAIRAWLEAFIERRSPQVPDPVRDAVRDQAQALLLFEDRDYPAAIQLLQQSRKDLMMEIGRRVLLQKVYFEKGDEELFSAQLAANLLFMHRKKDRLAAPKHQAYSLFFRSIGKLFEWKYQTAGADISPDSLREQIEQAEYLESRNWLLGRLR